MALQPTELYEGPTNQPPKKRILSTHSQPKTFAAGSGTIAAGTPVGVVESTGEWARWSSGTPEINTITSNGTPATAGTFKLIVNGETSAPIAYNATAAAVQAALEALEGVEVGDVTAVQTAGTNLGDASAIVTLTWADKALGDISIQIDTSGLTGNAHALATSQAGVAGIPVKGIVWPDPVVLSASGEVIGMTMLKGKAHIDDLELPAGETLATLKAAVKTAARPLGLEIEGYAGIS